MVELHREHREEIMVKLHRDPKGEISWQRSKDNLEERYHG